jgi:hypothetical protein
MGNLTASRCPSKKADLDTPRHLEYELGQQVKQETGAKPAELNAGAGEAAVPRAIPCKAAK